MRVMRRIALALFFSAAPVVFAQQRDAVIDQTIAALMRVQTFEQVAISPDASRIAYVKTVYGADSQKTAETGIYMGDKRITAAKPGSKTVFEEMHLAWSPDSSQLAFVSDASGQQQLYVAGRDGTVRAVTNVKGAFENPRWSPDGKSIAVLFIENASRKGGALEAMDAPSGDVETQVQEQRIAIIDPAARTLQFATSADMYIYDYDWSPDGRSFVAEAAFGAGEDNYWVAQLWRFDRGDLKGRAIYKPALQVATPKWSPDGKSIAFIEGLMSDEGSTGGDVFLMPADGGEAVNLTPRMAASATTLHWLNPQQLLIGDDPVKTMLQV